MATRTKPKRFSGKKLSGTSAVAKTFPTLTINGCSHVIKGDTYLNTDTGHLYQCTQGGDLKKSKGTTKWKYVSTSVVKKPSKKVTNLSAPARITVSGNNHWVEAKWKIPGDLISKKKGDRAESLIVTWTIDIPGKNDPKKVVVYVNEATTSARINLNAFGNYRRESFYPYNKKRTLDGVSVSVAPHNSKGTGTAVSSRLSFGLPVTPTISNLAFNPETGVVSATITTPAGAGANERIDTVYWVTVTDVRTNKTWQSTTMRSGAGTSIPVSYNVYDYQQLSFTQYVKVTVSAYARGYKGLSIPNPVRKSIFVSYPEQVTITGVDISSGNPSEGKCTVLINTNQKKNKNGEYEHPVDRVRLEYLADVTYASAAEIPGSASWESTEIVDDAACTALTMPVSSLIPEKGHHTYVRVKSYHLSETVLCRYSAPREITQLYTPGATAADDDITILSAKPGGDGESIIVKLGWNADGQDDSTGTELTWSDEEDTWKSTEEPSRHTFEWSDGPVTHEGTTYQDSAEITIKGLAEGTQYFIKARRYLEGDVTTYSQYSNPATAITSETPETIVAICERYVPTGASLDVAWTFSGNGIQQKWQIVSSNILYELTTDIEVEEGKSYYTYDSTEGTYTPVETTGEEVPYSEGWYQKIEDTTLAKGEDSMGSTKIGAERLAAFAVDGSVRFTVQASTGSGFVISEEHTVTILDRPTLSVNVPTPLTVQPLSFTATASRECDLVVIVTSLGAGGQFAEGVLQQTDGDTIYSTVYTPEWEAQAQPDDGWTTTVTLPTGLDFWDLGNYKVAVTAIDRSSGLRSTEATAVFGVAWAHQAPSIAPTEVYSLTADTEVVEDKPYFTYDSEAQTYIDVLPEGSENPQNEGWYELAVTECVTLTPVDITDENGRHRQEVQISLTPPPGSVETDVYDIYRLTGDRADLIGASYPLTYTVTDEYAPFGSDMTMYYRIAVRTVDGDEAFSDIEYVMDGDMMRFDWSGGTLELPYNISISDKYKKDSEIRQHMDGSSDAYWNQNVERSASLSSDVIRLEQQDEITAARHLGRYAGPVFVRTPDGSAYEADVQVSDMSTEGILTAIAIDATEIGLTQEFMLPPANEANASGTSDQTGE